MTSTTVADAPAGGPITRIDHIALTQPFDNFDEAALFYRALLGLSMQRTGEIAAASGVIRNRAFSRPRADGAHLRQRLRPPPR